MLKKIATFCGVALFTAVPATAQTQPATLATLFEDVFGPRGLVVSSDDVQLDGTNHAAHFNSAFQSDFRLMNIAIASQLTAVPVPSPASGFIYQFDSATGPNQILTGDITYISTHEGWLYLAVVIDLFSRRVVGMSMGRELSKGLVCDALMQAIRLRRPQPGALVHTDRGTQYSSSQYRQILQEHGFTQSMSAKGECYDNAPTESFFKTLKTEEVDRRSYKTRTEAARAIFHFIEVFYNRQRLHQTLGYQTPAAVESAFRVLN